MTQPRTKKPVLRPWQDEFVMPDGAYGSDGDLPYLCEG